MSSVTTTLPGVTIRFAVAADVPVILSFIEGLAEYEKLQREVTATPEKLHATLFGEQRFAEVLLAEENGEAVAFALFFSSYSTFLAQPGIYLEDLFVLPSARGRGIGTALLTYLARLTVERGCGRLEWSVLDWNEPAIRIYRALGAEPQNEWIGQRVTGPALTHLAQRFDHEFAG